MMMYRVIHKLKHSLFVTTCLLTISCTDFPEFPKIPLQQDMSIPDAMVDMMMDADVVEAGTVGGEMMSGTEVMGGEVPSGEVEGNIEVMEDMGPMLELDMEVQEPNFQATTCTPQNIIEGSDQRFENGIKIIGEPLPCGVPGEKFLRVDPITEPMQLSADQPRNPDIDQGCVSFPNNALLCFTGTGSIVTLLKACSTPRIRTEQSHKGGIGPY